MLVRAGGPISRPGLTPEETLALMHQKLTQWLIAQANGGDDDDRSLDELDALLARSNAAEVIQALSTDELNTPFGMDVVRQWMQKDLVAATNWVAANPAAMEDLTAVLAQGWVKDPAGMEAYLDQAPDGPWKQNFLLEAGAQLTVQNPEEAISLAQRMSPASAQSDFLASVAGDWISSDPAAASDWIMKVEDPTLRDKLVAAGAKAYALTNPRDAATWLASTVKSENTKEEAAISIVESWAVTDPLSAANWAASFPESEAKTTAQFLVTNYWLQTDPDAATVWLQKAQLGM